MIVIPANASPARRWLAHLVRVAAGSLRAGYRFEDDSALDEAAVLALARRHRVAPLLHLGSRKGRIGDPLSAGFREQCRNSYHATLRRNAVAIEIGSCVLAELASGGIPAAPCNGWALVDGSSSVHDDPGARPVDGLDLMVHRRNLERVCEVLGLLGFDPVPGRSAASLPGVRRVRFHRWVGSTHLFVELHGAPTEARGLPDGSPSSGDRFLDRFCEQMPRREGLLVPTRLGQLLFVAAHAASHGFGRWIWLLDMDRLLRAEPLGGEELLRAARELRIGGAVYAGLTAARELLGTPVPEPVLSELAPGPVRRQLLHRWLAGSDRETGIAGSGRLARVLLAESWWQVVRSATRPAASGRSWHPEPGLERTLAGPSRRIGGTA